MLALFFLNLALSQTFEHTTVYGNTESLCYYYTDVWVGTPPVRQTVILDTGSHITAFPCSGCENCGTHIDPYFDYKKSSTSRSVSCNEKINCPYCSDNSCSYSQSYAEGSSISGIFIEDFLRLGDEIEQSSQVKAVIGCHRRETQLFRTQKADGIMGLASSKNKIDNVVDALFKNSSISSNVFSLCLGKVDGFMTIGGYNTSMHHSEIKWVSLLDSSLYVIKILGAYIGNETLQTTASDFYDKSTPGAIVDSGTTFSFFTTKVYSKIFEALRKYCKVSGHCSGAITNVYGEPNSCFSYNMANQPDISAFFISFPIIYLKMKELDLEWRPENYLFAWPDTPNTFCVGIYSNGDGRTILGTNFMRGMDVIFDKENKRLGFADSDCSPIHTHNKSRSTIPYEQIPRAHTLTQFSVYPVIFASCSFMAALTFTILFCYRRQNKTVLDDSQE